MTMNPKLAEKPDHSHYPACLTRKTGIEDFSTKVFVYTTGISLVLAVMTFMGLQFTVVSWLPGIFSSYSLTLLRLFIQLLELAGLVALAAAGLSKYKICHILLFSIYSLMTFCGLFFRTCTLDLLILVIGVVGVLVTYKCFANYSDYNQLVATEGYPHFNEHLTHATEHPEYESRYAKEYHADSSDAKMSAPTKTGVPTFTGKSSMVDMPELETISRPGISAPGEDESLMNSLGGDDGYDPFDIQ